MTIGKAFGAGTPGIESGGACAECLWGCETISRNDTVLVKYAYLAEGMKARALTDGGAGLVYRGSMTFRRDSLGMLSFESAPIAAGWSPIPLSEDYYGISPYAFCAGDPINLVDEEGERPRIYIQNGGFGHAFITTGEGVKTTVYSYGRYGALDRYSGKTSGQSTPSGEGVLRILKGKDAATYLNKIKCLTRVVSQYLNALKVMMR